jgi:hypothetical protein
MRCEYAQAVVDRLSAVRRARQESHDSIRRRTRALRDGARRNREGLAARSGDLRAAVAERLGGIRRGLADRAAAGRRARAGGRERLVDSVAARLSQLREQTRLCRGCWSAAGDAV